MIPNSKLLNALRSRGYEFKDQLGRVCIYKLKGGTSRIEVRKHNYHGPDYCRHILVRAGMPLVEIEKFIAECTETRH